MTEYYTSDDISIIYVSDDDIKYLDANYLRNTGAMFVVDDIKKCNNMYKYFEPSHIVNIGGLINNIPLVTNNLIYGLIGNCINSLSATVSNNVINNIDTTSNQNNIYWDLYTNLRQNIGNIFKRDISIDYTPTCFFIQYAHYNKTEHNLVDTVENLDILITAMYNFRQDINKINNVDLLFDIIKYELAIYEYIIRACLNIISSWIDDKIKQTLTYLTEYKLLYYLVSIVRIIQISKCIKNTFNNRKFRFYIYKKNITSDILSKIFNLTKSELPVHGMSNLSIINNEPNISHIKPYTLRHFMDININPNSSFEIKQNNNYATYNNTLLTGDLYDSFIKINERVKPEGSIYPGVNYLNLLEFNHAKFVFIGENHYVYEPYYNNAFHNYINIDNKINSYIITEYPSDDKYSAHNWICEKLNGINVIDTDTRNFDFLQIFTDEQKLYLEEYVYESLSNKTTIITRPNTDQFINYIAEKNNDTLKYQPPFIKFVKMTNASFNIYTQNIDRNIYEKIVTGINNKTGDTTKQLILYQLYIYDYYISSALYIITNWICITTNNTINRNTVYHEVKTYILYMYKLYWYNKYSTFMGFFVDLNTIIKILELYNKHTNKLLIYITQGATHAKCVNQILLFIFQHIDPKLKNNDVFDITYIKNNPDYGINENISETLSLNNTSSYSNNIKSIYLLLNTTFYTKENVLFNEIYRNIKNNIVVCNIINEIFKIMGGTEQFKLFILMIASGNLRYMQYNTDQLKNIFDIDKVKFDLLSIKNICKNYYHTQVDFNQNIFLHCKEMPIQKIPCIEHGLEHLLTAEYNICFAEMVSGVDIFTCKSNALCSNNFHKFGDISEIEYKLYNNYTSEFDQLISVLFSTNKVTDNDKQELLKIYNDELSKIDTLESIKSWSTTIKNKLKAFYNKKGGGEYIADIFMASLFSYTFLCALLILIIIYMFYMILKYNGYLRTAHNNKCYVCSH